MTQRIEEKEQSAVGQVSLGGDVNQEDRQDGGGAGGGHDAEEKAE
jgi:hypothetical protein